MTTVTQGPDRYIRSRVEKPLTEADDKLFSWYDSTEEGG